MPQYRNPFEKGDLYIKFDVQFPENNWINPDKLSVSWFLMFLKQLICFLKQLPLVSSHFLLLLLLLVFLFSSFCFIIGSRATCTPGWPRTHSYMYSLSVF